MVKGRMATSFDTRPLRRADVREKNEKLALYLIKEKGPVSQREVVQATGLKPPTIMRIFNNLQTQDLIEPTAVSQESDGPGRRAAKYVVKSDAFYTVGIDFFACLISVVIQDFSGRVVSEKSVDLPGDMHASGVLFEIKKAVWSALASANVPQGKLMGLGVGSPGVVDTINGTVVFYSRIEGMRNFEIKRDFEETFGVPTVVHNNCSMIAQSEYRYGPVRGVKSLMALLVRGGLGGAFVRFGEPFQNQERTAFEVGHMSVDFQSSPCGGRGERGCLERWITEAALIEAAGLSSLMELDHALAQRDSRVLSALETPTEALSQAVLSLSNILNPEAFVIVSRSNELSTYLSGRVEARHQRDQYTSRDLNILFEGRVFDAVLACRGAIDLVMDKFFAGEIQQPGENR
jgi:predicted NBD/HSP70 family sugar kinase